MDEQPEEPFELKEWHKYAIATAVMAVFGMIVVFAPVVLLVIGMMMLAVVGVVALRHIMFW